MFIYLNNVPHVIFTILKDKAEALMNFFHWTLLLFSLVHLEIACGATLFNMNEFLAHSIEQAIESY